MEISNLLISCSIKFKNNPMEKKVRNFKIIASFRVFS